MENAKQFKMSIHMHVLNNMFEPLGYEIKHNNHNFIVAPNNRIRGGVSFTVHLPDEFLDKDEAIRFYSYFQLPNWFCDPTNCEAVTKWEVGTNNNPLITVHTLDEERKYISREFADQSHYVLYTLEQIIQIISRSNKLSNVLRKYKIEDTSEYGTLDIAKGMTLYQLYSKQSEKHYMIDGDWYLYYYPKNRELKFDPLNVRIGGQDLLLNENGEFETILVRMIEMSKVNSEIQKAYRDTIKKLNEELTPKLTSAKEKFLNAFSK